MRRPPLRLVAILLPVASVAAAAAIDLREHWQPLPHPSLPSRDPVLGPAGPPAHDPPPGAAPVVLISVDTWRADRLPLYGSPRALSPWLSAFAEQAVVFDRAIAPAPWTWPTMASLASGLYPRAHGAVLPGLSLCDEAATLAELFHDAGWRTGFAGINTYFEPEDSGYRQGFEYFWAGGLQEGSLAVEYAGHFLQPLDADPFFLQVHLFDPHCPYDPTPEALAAATAVPFGRAGASGEGPVALRTDLTRQMACHMVPPPPADEQEEALRSGWKMDRDRQSYYDAYDGELLETDRHLAALQARLEAAGAWDRAWIVVTGDHGEEFEEHGKIGHGYHLYRESVQVPLLIRPPGGKAGRVAQPVSLVDVPMTLARGAGLPPPTSWQGRDLGPLLRGEATPAWPVLSETVYSNAYRALSVDLPAGRLVVSGHWPRGELFGPDDPTDVRGLLDGGLAGRVSALGLAARLRDEVRQVHAGRVCSGNPYLADPTHWETLRRLGYLDDPTGVPERGDPDAP